MRGAEDDEDAEAEQAQAAEAAAEAAEFGAEVRRKESTRGEKSWDLLLCETTPCSHMCISLRDSHVQSGEDDCMSQCRTCSLALAFTRLPGQRC